MPAVEPAPYVASAAASPVPAGFTDLATIPGLHFRVAYATADNFTGAPLPGYGWPGAWLAAPAAAALARAATALAALDYALVVFDGYRPARASAAMVAWAERVGRTDLLGVYIARRSGHNDGGSVDVGLADLRTGALLDMGSPFDTFDATAHIPNATGDTKKRRAVLGEVMIAQGWEPYSMEWWHFRFEAWQGAARDVPYGASEAPEETIRGEAAK
ncbi:MAG: M15 family metallopeptidase [Myxococcota bacterium]